MKTSRDRILTTHVGSIVRPPALLDAIRSHQSGQGLEENAFAALLRDSVAEVVKQQVEAGVDIVSDGEFGKSSYQGYAHERLSGFGELPTPVENPRVKWRDRRDFPEFYAESAQGNLNPIRIGCIGPISYTGQAILQRDLANFRAAVNAAGAIEGFVAAISPGHFGHGENQYYKTEEEFVFAVADAMKQEYRAIVDAGFVLQIDAPVGMYDIFDLTKEQFRHNLEVASDALRHALAGIPTDRVRYHVCWGSWNAPHTHDAPLLDMIDILLKLPVGALSLEAANPRHEHEFQVWQQVKLPEDKVLLPGLVSHATNVVEHPDLIAWRIKNFASAVGRENVIASTDCGFAQGAFTRRCHPSVMWAKLRALAEGARIASKELWRA